MSRIQDLPDDDRPREKLARLGAASLNNAELLALFIGSGNKNRNAIEIGNDMIRHFGSLNALGGAGLDELLSCPGIGPARASLLAAAFELGARVAREHISQTTLDSPERIHEAFAPQLAWLGQERLLIATVDSRLRHTGTIEISSGTLNETSAHPREVLRPVMLRNAYGFILIHNHPSGDPGPSQADRQFTKRLAEGAELLQLRFVDHIIIGRPDHGRSPYYSFREAGLL
ncbi:RadC family protein [Haloferula sp.]|uniref:RadC family protein n=1 Tax=Haloferula sp. TaxID=2497595 RepID=UPI003C749D8E